jgi:hypothetical protein
MSYHITDLDSFNANVGLFREAHWMPCQDKIICACLCRDDDAHGVWSALPAVTNLPDPLRNQAVGTQAPLMACYNVLATDTTFDVCDKLTKINPSFRFDFK